MVEMSLVRGNLYVKFFLCLFSLPAPLSARNVRPKMTIYVCQELEQNQVPLPQKQDDNGDNSLCGEWNRASA